MKRQEWNERQAIYWAWRNNNKAITPPEFKEVVALYKHLGRQYPISDLCWGWRRFKVGGMPMSTFKTAMTGSRLSRSPEWFDVQSVLAPWLDLIERLDKSEDKE